MSIWIVRGDKLKGIYENACDDAEMHKSASDDSPRWYCGKYKKYNTSNVSRCRGNFRPEFSRNCPLEEMSNSDFFELCEKGSLQQINDAIKNGASVNARNDNGFTPLTWAALNNPDPEVLTALIKEGADVDAANGETALMSAVCGNSSPKLIELLLRNGADINACAEGMTALTLAIGKNADPEIIELLLKNGADINAVNKDGLTALMSAAMRNSNPEIIELLLEYGADIKTASESDFTEYAASKNPNPEVIEVLQKYIAKKKIG